MWNWVEKLTSAGDQHELEFIFVLPAHASADYERTLKMALCLPEMDIASAGHALWRQSGSLSELLELVAAMRPADLVPLRARRAVDARHATLARLRSAVANHDLSKASEAARGVLAIFSGQEYRLDVFCRAPSHRHGNFLRAWLNAAVTGGVTQDWLKTGTNHLSHWLANSEDKRQT